MKTMDLPELKQDFEGFVKLIFFEREEFENIQLDDILSAESRS